MPEESKLPLRCNRNDFIDPLSMGYIIKSGIQAPSGDNAQPWHFSYDANAIHLYLNEDADRSFFNISQIAIIISCGAVLENMKIAATKFKLIADIRYESHRRSEKKVATLFLSRDENIKKDPLSEFIWKRQTNRKIYKKNRGVFLCSP